MVLEHVEQSSKRHLEQALAIDVHVDHQGTKMVSAYVRVDSVRFGWRLFVPVQWEGGSVQFLYLKIPVRFGSVFVA